MPNVVPPLVEYLTTVVEKTRPSLPGLPVRMLIVVMVCAPPRSYSIDLVGVPLGGKSLSRPVSPSRAPAPSVKAGRPWGSSEPLVAAGLAGCQPWSAGSSVAIRPAIRSSAMMLPSRAV